MLYPVTPKYYNLQPKTTEKHSPHNAITQQTRHGNLHLSLPFKTWHHRARIQLSLCAFLPGGAFSLWFCFRRVVSSGWSGRRQVLSVVLLPVLLVFVWWCFPLLSSVGWRCLLLLGSGAYLILSLGGLRNTFRHIAAHLSQT